MHLPKSMEEEEEEEEKEPKVMGWIYTIPMFRTFTVLSVLIFREVVLFS